MFKQQKHLTKKAQRAYYKEVIDFMDYYEDMVATQESSIAWDLGLVQRLEDKVKAWEVLQPIAHEIAGELEYYSKIVKKGIIKIRKYLENNPRVINRFRLIED